MQDIKNYVELFEDFEKRLNGQSKQPFHMQRVKAIDTLKETGFPKPREEEWRFTNISPLLKTKFKLSEQSSLEKVSKADVERLSFAGWDGPVLVIVNGMFSRELSRLDGISDKVSVMPLSVALAENHENVKGKINTLSGLGDAFTYLNTAFASDGIFVEVPDNVIQEKDIHILHIAAAGHQTMAHPRHLFVVGKSARLGVTESFHAQDCVDCFTNSVTEIFVAENGEMEHYKLQDENLDGYHMGQIHLNQGANSRLYSINFAFGGKLVRNSINTELAGEGIESVLNGLYMAHGDQLIDNHTFIDHAKAHCESHELYRGILKDKARGVFSGKIMVRQDAQKTDAKQSNNCLLLSDDARINTKPQLEIYADDVKCTHGATIGQLDEEAVFYLRSRGVPQKKAVSILTYAFAEEIIEGIRNEAVKARVNELLEKRLQEDLDFIKE